MPTRSRITFPNPIGQSLAGSLALPDQSPRAFVLFAHCFTCGKDIRAASRISQVLAASGYAVLRFDFTGLGESEGDFAETNFTSNVDDLVSAANYLRLNHEAPSVLIGHSLGGTGVLAAADQIPECKAVATIGSPATPAHLLKHVSPRASTEPDEYGITVSIAGRDIRLQQQFVHDLSQDVVTERVRNLRRALLVMHAPFDNIVSIEQASLIFQTAKHPKSFVTLDGADHLLSQPADAEYAANVITAWLQRYLDAPERTADQPVAGGLVRVEEANNKFLRQITTDDHAWVADEPINVGGDNLGPDPYEHLLAALGACTSMTIRMYANRKGLNLEDVEIELAHSREYIKDCEDCEQGDRRIDVLTRSIRFTGELTAEQTQRLLEIADRCPVHRTLEGELQITTQAIQQK
ncbi:MAG: bifunctional alpha/beta hydrolase/OsmC family protein [Pseudomonadales bacterium]